MTRRFGLQLISCLDFLSQFPHGKASEEKRGTFFLNLNLTAGSPTELEYKYLSDRGILKGSLLHLSFFFSLLIIIFSVAVEGNIDDSSVRSLLNCCTDFLSLSACRFPNTYIHSAGQALKEEKKEQKEKKKERPFFSSSGLSLGTIG